MQSNPANISDNLNEEEESFSFANVLADWRRSVGYALRSWKIILLVGLLGALIGLGYAWIKHDTYTARLTFVVEEAKGSGGSIASAIAGQFGFDLGGMSGSNGVLSGDNVLELLKSHTLIKNAILTAYDSAHHSIADRYAEVYQWKEKWKADEKIGKDISFPAGKTEFTRLEDSLLQTIVLRLAEKELSISKPDKKLGFFTIEASTRDERLSQLITERLLKITTDFYVEAKTRRISNNVARLQRRADSLGMVLDRKTYSNAAANQALLDANPAYSSPVVSAEISSRDKFIQSTVYAEIIKSLEVNRTSLVQETPTVQIVDYPDLPLRHNKVKMPLAALLGFFAGAIIALAFLTFLKKK